MTSETAAAEYIPGRSRSEIARKVLLYGVYLVVAAIFLTPFVWTLVTSFKTLNDSLNFNLIPHPWTTRRCSRSVQARRPSPPHSWQCWSPTTVTNKATARVRTPSYHRVSGPQFRRKNYRRRSADSP